VIAQLKSTPIAKDGLDAGEAVDPKWEGAHGHAALRYGAFSRTAPSPERLPELSIDEWAAEERRRETGNSLSGAQ